MTEPGGEAPWAQGRSYDSMIQCPIDFLAPSCSRPRPRPGTCWNYFGRGSGQREPWDAGPSEPAGSRLERPIAALLVLLLLAVAVALSAQRIQSQDYWWHLRSGQLIADTGAIPKVDPYTYTAAGSRWIDIQWLFQISL